MIKLYLNVLDFGIHLQRIFYEALLQTNDQNERSQYGTSWSELHATTQKIVQNHNVHFKTSEVGLKEVTSVHQLHDS